MQSPDEKVAESVVAALRDKKLVSESRIAELSKKLVAGSITSQDWRRIAEATLDEEKKAKNVEPH